MIKGEKTNKMKMVQEYKYNLSAILDSFENTLFCVIMI